MYTLKDILKILNEFNYFIEEQVLATFVKNWKIDPIYEDEDGVEFFDNVSLAKIKKGIKLKSQGYDTEKIIFYVAKIMGEETEKAEEKKVEESPKVEEKKEESTTKAALDQTPAAAITAVQGSELKNFTLDITGQTLQMLAEAVAQKITTEIKEQLKSTDFIQQLMPKNETAKIETVITDETLKRDNELLAKKVEELLSDNKKLAERVSGLEKKKKSIFGLWG